MFSSKTFIAIEAVLFIACHSGAEPVRSCDICAYQKVTKRHLEPLMQRLVKANILRGQRGPKGGYFLARERRKILLSDIANVTIDLYSKGELSLLNKNIIMPIQNKLLMEFLSQFSKVTIEDLWLQAKAQGLEKSFRQKSDFSI